MPAGAAVPAPTAPVTSQQEPGLAGVDLRGEPPVTSRASSARFEEYQVDDRDERDVPAARGEVEVVRVRRKKKGKEGRLKVEGS